jgi:hypothetical protein
MVATSRLLGRSQVVRQRIAWVRRRRASDASDITNWTTGLADSETFATGGIVRGIAGGEVGYIFQDSIIRRMVSRFGDPVTGCRAGPSNPSRAIFLDDQLILGE